MNSTNSNNDDWWHHCYFLFSFGRRSNSNFPLWRDKIEKWQFLCQVLCCDVSATRNNDNGNIQSHQHFPCNYYSRHHCPIVVQTIKCKRGRHVLPELGNTSFINLTCHGCEYSTIPWINLSGYFIGDLNTDNPFGTGVNWQGCLWLGLYPKCGRWRRRRIDHLTLCNTSNGNTSNAIYSSSRIDNPGNYDSGLRWADRCSASLRRSTQSSTNKESTKRTALNSMESCLDSSKSGNSVRRMLVVNPTPAINQRMMAILS